ncbi:MAG: subfamily B ATP-binding cassette protein MsbA [Candidatus Deianiraeaceae bacterium]|jgi:subfamily B ATP-binding cassette protein MsbA
MKLDKENNTLYKVLYALIFFKSYIDPFRIKFFIAIALMVVVAVTMASYAYLVKEVLDKVFIEKDTRMLVLLPAIIIIITIVKNLALFFQTRMMQVIMAKVTLKIQAEIYKKYVYSDMEFFDNTSTSSMVTKLFHTTGAISDGIHNILVIAIREFLTVIALFAVLFFHSPQLTLLSLLSLPFTVFPVVIISKKLRKSMRESHLTMEYLMSHVDDSLKSPKLVKSNVAEEYEIIKTNRVFDVMICLGRKMAVLSSALPSINETISIFGVAVVIWYGGSNVIKGTMTSGEFFAFFTAMTIAYKPLKSLTRLNCTMQMFVVSSDIVRAVLERKNKIQNTPNPVELTRTKGNIEFKNVFFSYNGSNSILEDISFSVQGGKTLAIVGPTGAGKSTVISLLERFYDVNMGVVSIDGKNITDYTISSLRKSMALVSQDVHLLNDTIESNIRYTKLDATHEEIIKAANLANAEEFIKKMPDGYQTQVGQSGVKLSGGQKQRIAIARAILYNAPIVLLDEATSALDSISEKLIQDALDKFMNGRTTIAIAHRLSTIINADQIIVMRDGRVVEEGTHSELITYDGHYKRLYSTQFGT